MTFLTNELPEERALLCDDNWLFDLTFFLDVTCHINEKKLKMLGKSKFCQSLVDDINTFNMKSTMFASQLESDDYCKFPHLDEQGECAAGSLARYTEKINDKIK